MAKQKQEEKVRRLNRHAAANQVVAAIGGKATLSELAEKADALFVEHGGKSKLRSAAYHVRCALETAESVGVVRLTRPTDTMVEKVRVK